MFTGSSESLRVSLADLRSSTTKGKWWLVGAAWSGNPLVDKQAEIAATSASAEREASASGKEAQLLKLAKKQGMNTDVRRRIFVALMSGEVSFSAIFEGRYADFLLQDYVDATSRLNALGLTEVQQREIIRVLLHCLSNEKTYNPYYTLIVSRLLTGSSTSNTHSYQITLQYCLWDFFRALGESEVGGAEMIKSGFGTSSEGGSSRRSRNMAKAYAWWCAKSGLGLNIFKVSSSTECMRHDELMLDVVLSASTISNTTDGISSLPGAILDRIDPLNAVYVTPAHNLSQAA
jgi:nucleolar MIF4G domain-containing protein 1